MGLDSYWFKPETNKVLELKFDPPIFLCGGMMSGHGSGSFRGKVYNAFIEDITGESLYQAIISPEIVTKMADKLAKISVRKRKQWLKEIELSELKDLIRMFQAYAKEGAELRGWW